MPVRRVIASSPPSTVREEITSALFRRRRSFRDDVRQVRALWAGSSNDDGRDLVQVEFGEHREVRLVVLLQGAEVLAESLALHDGVRQELMWLGLSPARGHGGAESPCRALNEVTVFLGQLVDPLTRTPALRLVHFEHREVRIAGRQKPADLQAHRRTFQLSREPGPIAGPEADIIEEIADVIRQVRLRCKLAKELVEHRGIAGELGFLGRGENAGDQVIERWEGQESGQFIHSVHPLSCAQPYRGLLNRP